MVVLWICTLCAATAASSRGDDAIVKNIVNTVPWWPPANLVYEEAVGVVSHSRVYMTGMMERNYSVNASVFNASYQFGLALLDIHDIVAAGNSSMQSLVSCLGNVPAGAATAEVALRQRIGAACIPLTILETKGEDPQYNSSLTCVAATNTSRGQPAHLQRFCARNDDHDGHGVVEVAAVRSGDTVWVSASAAASAESHNRTHTPRTATTNGDDNNRMWAHVQTALMNVTNNVATLLHLVDCTLFLPPSTTATEAAAIAEAAIVASSVNKNETTPPMALTIAFNSLGANVNIKIQCVASVGGGTKKRVVVPPARSIDNNNNNYALGITIAGGFAYVDGIGSRMANASDALEVIEHALVAVGTRMDLVLNCLFWVPNEDGVDPFFHGFHDAFNVNISGVFSPPSRTEFVGSSPASQCIGGVAGPKTCPVISKCVAAMPKL